VTAVVAHGLDANTLRVEDVMTIDLVSAREDDSLIDLMRTMRRKGVRRVPVVGAQGELIGVVTLDDVLTILAEELGLLVAAIDSEGRTPASQVRFRLKGPRSTKRRAASRLT
jgi:signal-transduction protein with cAMP-binding, CBS, and nucleotidyltransferase domain